MEGFEKYKKMCLLRNLLDYQLPPPEVLNVEQYYIPFLPYQSFITSLKLINYLTLLIQCQMRSLIIYLL